MASITEVGVDGESSDIMDGEFSLGISKERGLFIGFEFEAEQVYRSTINVE
jgi:hypothetical protein